MHGAGMESSRMTNTSKQAKAPKPKHFDIKHMVAKLPKPGSIVTPSKKPKNSAKTVMIEVPVSVGFNWGDVPVGFLFLTPEAASILRAGFVLAPAYETTPKHKLIGAGIIPAANALPPKTDEDEPIRPPDGRYQGFMWHLFLIAMVCGMLAILAILIRLFYVKG